MSGLLLGSALVSLLQLDTVSVGQFMVSRPIVVGPAVGAALGEPSLGGLIGLIVETALLDGMPMGGVIPPNGAISAGVAVIAVSVDPYLSLGAAVLAGLAFGKGWGTVETRLRQRRALSFGKMEGGSPVEKEVAKSVGAEFLFGFGFAFLGGATAVFLGGALASMAPALSDSLDTAIPIAAGIAGVSAMPDPLGPEEKLMDRFSHAQLFLRSLLFQAGWNFERMQALGLSFVLDPVLRRAWQDGEGLSRARARHAAPFNTQPYMASYAIGLCAKMEGLLATAPVSGRRSLEDELIGMKRSLGPALAGIGDSLFWGALRPASLLGAVFLALLLGGFRPSEALIGPAVPVLFLLLYNAVALPVRWTGISSGYRSGRDLPALLMKTPWKKATVGLRRAALVCLAGILLSVLFSSPGTLLFLVLAVGAAVFARTRGASGGVVFAGSLVLMVLFELGAGR